MQDPIVQTITALALKFIVYADRTANGIHMKQIERQLEKVLLWLFKLLLVRISYQKSVAPLGYVGIFISGYAMLILNIYFGLNTKDGLSLQVRNFISC